MGWACGIAGCDARFDDVEGLLRHQAVDHEPRECGVCGEQFPAGFFAIRHAFEEHTRAEYLRAYDADSDDIRVREQVKEEIEERVDVSDVLEEVGVVEPAMSAGD